MQTANKSTKKINEPLFHIVKRTDIPLKYSILIRAGAIIIGLILLGTLVSVIGTDADLFSVYDSLINGAIGSERRTWLLLQDAALLLGVALGLCFAFKMKFWNLGGNGQILMGCLAATACMHLMGDKYDNTVIIICMIFASILAGAIWAVIPALFKAFFNTNESLFTLMMNYIATSLVSYFISLWAKSGSGVLTPIEFGNLPVIKLGFISPAYQKHILPIIVIIVLTLAAYVYLKYSKQGYEISVVGESERTARYVGINVKKVIIRTMCISGALCGIVGLLLSGAINHTVSEEMANNMGFTAIMVAWLSKFNPLIMAAVSFFIVFLDKGMKLVRSDYGFTNDSLSNVVIAIIYICVISCEFFINYKIVFRTKQSKEGK